MDFHPRLNMLLCSCIQPGTPNKLRLSGGQGVLGAQLIGHSVPEDSGARMPSCMPLHCVRRAVQACPPTESAPWPAPFAEPSPLAPLATAPNRCSVCQRAATRLWSQGDQCAGRHGGSCHRAGERVQALPRVCRVWLVFWAASMTPPEPARRVAACKCSDRQLPTGECSVHSRESEVLCPAPQALPETNGFLTGETIVVNQAPTAVLRFWDMACERDQRDAHVPVTVVCDGCASIKLFLLQNAVGRDAALTRQGAPPTAHARPAMHTHPPTLRGSSRPPPHPCLPRPPLHPTCRAAASSFPALQPTATFVGHSQIPTAARGVAGDANLFVSGERTVVLPLSLPPQVQPAGASSKLVAVDRIRSDQGHRAGVGCSHRLAATPGLSRAGILPRGRAPWLDGWPALRPGC